MASSEVMVVDTTTVRTVTTERITASVTSETSETVKK
jgi:hypothetical protein